MNKREIIRRLKEYVETHIPKSRRPSERYLAHVFGARKYAKLLTNKYIEDSFIIDSAILLHDIGADAGISHAQKSAEMAKNILFKLNVNQDDTIKILECIKTHSIGPAPKTIRQQIIQDADGLIFIKDTYKDFYKRKASAPDTPLNVIKETQSKTKAMMKKIRTPIGKTLAKKLLPKALSWITSQGESTLTVKRGDAGDLKNIQSLNNKLFKHDYAFDKALDLKWPYRKTGITYYKKALTDKDYATFLVKTITGKTVGYLIGTHKGIPEYRENVNIVELDNIYVEKTYRKKNVGKMLFAELQLWARAKGANTIKVNAYSKNSNALSFYKKIGFKDAETILEQKI